MLDFYANYGIVHQRSCVECPQQNGLVERKHQHIVNVPRSFKIQSKLSTVFWNYFIGYVVHIINRLPFPLLDNKSPYELLYDKIPDYNSLRSFGCLCYVSTLSKGRTKFSNRAENGVFIGFENGVKGYRIYSIDSNKVVILRDVRFHVCFHMTKMTMRT